ncbi:MAG: two-component regulator propeller domain-containing protein, partial [Bacteroidota bacterium]|nr:two-component regulator propeller domain-containing protein [Bacteroidota bacterium]
GLLWVGTNNKLNIFMRESGQFQQYTQTSKNNSLSNDDIQSIYEDDANNIWIGTYKGVNKFDRSSSKFTHYDRSFETPNTMSSNIVYGILEDSQGFLWLGTRNGVNVLDRNSGEYSQIHYLIEEGHDLADARIRSVLEDRNGTYWIGTEDFGLFKYEQDKKQFTQYRHDPSDPNSISDNGILAMIEGSDAKLWIGTYRGLNVYDPETNAFQRYQYNPKDQQSLSHDIVWTVYEDRQGHIWVGTYHGLNRFIKDSGIFIRYEYNAEDIFSISNNNIASIYEDENGIYWIATMGGGLNRFDHSLNKFTHFTSDDGLPNNVTYATLEDNKGNFWIPTNWGLSKFNRTDSTFSNYDVLDGLQGNEFNGNANFVSREGEIFVGGMNGFNAFFPEEIKLNTKIPKVAIIAFKKFNEIQPFTINDGDTIFLEYNDNFFSFEFTALDYTNPSKNKYKYKLDSYDIDWIQRDADRRIAEYANVRPGTYAFNVKASNNDGIWNDTGFSITIVITPPWWATWTFRLPFALFIIVGTWYLIYRRITHIKTKHQVEKKMLQFEKQLFDIEQRALRLQMNPHFIFNSLNAIQSFVIANDTDKAIHYMAKFSQLMRLILSNSRESHIPVKDELKALTYFMDIEKLRFDNKFDYNLKIDPKIDDDFIAIPPMIIQPYVENAILHGLIHRPSRGKIDIEFSLIKDTIFCSIQDNGIGREEAMKIREASGIKRKSKGMLITKERIDLLNKQYKGKYSVRVIDLKNNKEESLGTRVEITMVYIEI